MTKPRMERPYLLSEASLDAAIVCWCYDAITRFVMNSEPCEAAIFTQTAVVQSYYRVLVMICVKQGEKHAKAYALQAFGHDGFGLPVEAIIRLHENGYADFDIATMHALAKGD